MSFEKLDIYAPHFGIAQQSLWFGIDDDVDDFILSLAAGFYYVKFPQVSPRKALTN